MKKRTLILIHLSVISVLFLMLAAGCKKSNDEPSVIKDGDGNVYTSVKIGTQTWLAKDLKTTKLNDGTPIPLVTDNTEWTNLTTPGYCWYGNDEAANKNVYGGLYNWYTVNTGKLCPRGWHVPSNDEATVLNIFIDGEGGKLKETGTVHWRAPNTGATDQYGFTALPGGYRGPTGIFADIKSYGGWWTTTERSQLNTVYICILPYDVSGFSTGAEVKKNSGYSVRCIKD